MRKLVFCLALKIIIILKHVPIVIIFINDNLRTDCIAYIETATIII